MAVPGDAVLPRRRLAPQRIVLADDNRMFRRELLGQIGQVMGNIEIHEVQSAHELFDICGRDAAANDMLVVDMAMPGLGGSEGLCTLSRLQPEATIIAIGCPPDATVARAIFDAGVSAYILRSMSGRAFAAALALVTSGERFFPATLMLPGREHGAGCVAGPQPAGTVTARAFADGLTPRQQEVLQHLSMGKSNKDIARALKIEEITVKVHLRAIFVCLNVSNRTQAAMHAQRAGWFPVAAVDEPLAAIGYGTGNAMLTH